MASERDLSDLLPPPPPPRPDRREAAIGAALRRFDGVADQPVRNAAPLRRWRLTAKPQLGLLAAAALAAAIGLPLWLSSEHQPPDFGVGRKPTAIEVPVTTAVPTQADTAAEPPANAPISQPRPIVRPSAAAPAARPAVPRATVLAAPVVAAPPSAPPAAISSPSQSAAFAAAPPPPAPILREAEDQSNAGADVIVTGTRVTVRAKAQQRIERRLAERGDWNRCTIDDPRQDVDACRPHARAAASTPARQAAVLVADGLTAAWRGDPDGAIAAFDRAIAVSPRLSAAWLNRGLAHAKAGDAARALADLDRAVEFAPGDARGWFQRSLILRREGMTGRANADAARAVELDPRYEDVVE